MSTKYFIRQATVAAMFALMMWLPALTAQAAEQPTQILTAPVSASPHASVVGLNETASGAVEDTIKACMARIPDGASVGQRMMAEASCKRDKSERTSIDAVPEV